MATTTRTNAEEQKQNERRFATIDRDVAGLKLDVGVLQADVKTLAAGQVALQISQDKGFADLKETLASRASEPPKIGLGMLISLIGLMISALAIGFGTFWAAVLLLANPIKEEVRNLRNYVTASDASLSERMHEIESESRTHAEEAGRRDVYDEWLRSDAEAAKRALQHRDNE